MIEVKKGRVLGFAKQWEKLSKPEFTTFRYPRADKDWYTGERVQIVIHPRSPERLKLGMAEIINIEQRELDSFFTDGKIVKPIGVPLMTDVEAQEDGFLDLADMVKWMQKTYGMDYISLMNKITLKWVK